MEGSAIQHIPAIIEQAAKSPLGLFALMIVAISILGFFFFRDASERTRMGMFVLMFVGVVSFGVAALRSLPGDSSASAPNVGAAADVVGEWRAKVTYDWGDVYTENFIFTHDGVELMGTASYLGKRRTLFDGRLQGDRLSFIIKTQEVLGGDDITRDVVHHYTGKALGERIQFVMRTEGGFSEHVPVEFAAERMR